MVKVIDSVEVYYEDYRDTDQSADIVIINIVSNNISLIDSLPLHIAESLKSQYREIILKGE